MRFDHQAVKAASGPLPLSRTDPVGCPAAPYSQVGRFADTTSVRFRTEGAGGRQGRGVGVDRPRGEGRIWLFGWGAGASSN
eukprot:3019983-Pyramimonas_sp.AAC.1